MEDRMHQSLEARRQRGEYRQLSTVEDKIDFSSNDYLGLSRSAWIEHQVRQSIREGKVIRRGATGSRLLTGNSKTTEQLEAFIADVHSAPAALLMNSGYAANVGLLSTVLREGDVVLYDELVHASIHEGMKLGKADAFSFPHNDFNALRTALESHRDNVVFVVVESVYSMDGDHAPLVEIKALKKDFNFNLIVDEAHALGVFGKSGRGLCEKHGLEADCFARIYTFGKAMGSHGAVIVGSKTLRSYLINFCKPFIYSTAVEHRHLHVVKHTYEFVLKKQNQIVRLLNLIEKFKSEFLGANLPEILGEGPVFAVLIPNPETCRTVANELNRSGFDVRPIVYPTVARGSERIRISLHSFNTEDEVRSLAKTLGESLLKNPLR